MVRPPGSLHSVSMPFNSLDRPGGLLGSRVGFGFGFRVEGQGLRLGSEVASGHSCFWTSNRIR